MNQYDHYPLMAPVNMFNMGTWCGTSWNISVVSNSTVSGIHFNPDEGPIIRFNVTGENGTEGFCSVAIPRSLLWVDDGWTIRVGDAEIKNYTTMQDEEYTYLYFAYNHSTKTVYIIGTHAVPEFPSVIVILFFISTTIPAIVFLRKRALTKSRRR
jgi:hypothetical protein